jgi:hypothetical protein
MKACGIEYVARNGEVFVYAAAISKAVKYRRSSTISNYVMRRYISPKGAPKREFENMHMHYGYFTLTELKKMGFKKDAFGKPITNENATLKQDIISLRFLEEVISSSTYKYYAAVTNIIDCIKFDFYFLFFFFVVGVVIFAFHIHNAVFYVFHV